MEIKNVISSRILVGLLFSLLFNSFIFAQNKNPIFFQFDEKSKELCNVHPTRRGRLHKVENISKYGIVYQNNGNISFYICGEKFIYEKSRMRKSIVCKNFLRNKKLMDYEELVNFLNKMQDKYPMGPKYPSKEYPTRMYIPINLSDGRITLYEIKWQYYIE